jgi:Lrp/AsnC family transcriptional regulator, leucine-responsive regulatory protein
MANKRNFLYNSFETKEYEVNHLGYRNGGLDEVDRRLLELLAADGRAAIADLARRVGMSAPSVSERLRRMEEAGVIRGYGVDVDPGAIGLAISALIRVKPLPGQLKEVAERLRDMPEVTECHRVTGEDCYVVRADVRSVADLEMVIDRINPYATTNSSIIQSSPVPRRLPALPRPD